MNIHKFFNTFMIVALAVTLAGVPMTAFAQNSGTIDTNVDQADAWVYNPGNGHYYRLTGPLTWFDAEAQAQDWGGHLVTLDNAGEELWIKDTFGRYEHFWIGFSDIKEEGVWVWSSGAPVTYTNWDEWEPNNCCFCTEYPGCEDAAVMNWQAETGDGTYGDYWNDLAPDNEFRGVVERSLIYVNIDIKPGSDPNSINCENKKEVITVAVLTTEDFDALTIDHTTVTFEGASETHVNKKTGKLQRHMEDVDFDGDMDLVFHFLLGNTTLSCGSMAGTLTGRTFDGVPVTGIDSIRTVKVGDCGYTPDSAGLSCQDILDRCPGTQSGEKWIEPDGTNAILAYCSMDEEGNGWTLIYNRNNAYFSPDHMYNELPAQGPGFSSNSTSWFIPIDATRWLWEVSVDSGASYRTLETSIPLEARSTTHATVENAPIVTVYENTTGASGPFYFQTITFLDKCLYGCDSGRASWWGIVNVSQGAGDQANPGLGGHTDWCSMNSMLLPGDNYTWGDGDLEYYLSDWKDIGGDGIGGTNCNPYLPTTQYRYHFWAR